ncbi:Ribosome maturation factor RimM [Rickettsiales endosymbiont of Paramecium tredecaurelia]|uniref:ribosome maturation factor RimM n=1 Tax=Candidatus Sarmatiella mevalonica TaxID=2770581 RepID=UPI0019222CA4|nr:ribosome maturation factor RimM [Candidatus Sarmatiella mevalonica]MBL3284412.1 Ribosome maturation factor RimM [Candidatus Sarmatiella mevalonica]
MNKTELCLVGVVAKSHGILGKVIIHSFTHIPQTIFTFNLIDEQCNEHKIKMLSAKSANRFICEMNNARSRTEAETLQGLQLFCLKQCLPKIEDEDEFYIENLKNLPVVNSKSMYEIGIVRDVLNFGAGDILEIVYNDGVTDLILFTKQNFPSITNQYVLINLTD